MNGWFIAIIVLYIIEIGYQIGKHGEERTVQYNFWSSLITTLIFVFLTYKAIEMGF